MHESCSIDRDVSYLTSWPVKYYRHTRRNIGTGGPCPRLPPMLNPFRASHAGQGALAFTSLDLGPHIPASGSAHSWLVILLREFLDVAANAGRPRGVHCPAYPRLTLSLETTYEAMKYRNV